MSLDAPFWKIGAATVSLIRESEGIGTAPTTLFPDFRRDAFDAALACLEGDIHDDDADGLKISFHSWLIEMGGLRILVDPPAGNGKERPNNPRFHRLDTFYLANLAAAGCAPEDIDIVVSTHLHGDHCGWNTVLRDGFWTPSFPRARYLLCRRELEHVRNAAPDGAEAGVYADSVLPVIEAGLANFVSSGSEIAPGLSLIPAPGHTPHHMMLLLVSEGAGAIFPGDVFHHPVQIVQPDWNSRYCALPGVARLTRLSVLEQAARTGDVLFSSHFPDHSAGSIQRSANRFGLLPIDPNGRRTR